MTLNPIRIEIMLGPILCRCDFEFCCSRHQAVTFVKFDGQNEGFIISSDQVVHPLTSHDH